MILTLISDFCYSLISFFLIYLNFISHTIYFSMCVSLYPFSNDYIKLGIEFGGLKWNRTIDLTLIRRAL